MLHGNTQHNTALLRRTQSPLKWVGSLLALALVCPLGPLPPVFILEHLEHLVSLSSRSAPVGFPPSPQHGQSPEPACCLHLISHLLTTPTRTPPIPPHPRLSWSHICPCIRSSLQLQFNSLKHHFHQASRPPLARLLT